MGDRVGYGEAVDGAWGMTDESQRDELKFGLGGLLDRGALSRLQTSRGEEATQAEGPVTDALYPPRRLHTSAHETQDPPVAPGVELAQLPDAIRTARWLAPNERMRLLASVRGLAAFVEEARARGAG
jgi:hypothetical protein